MTTKRKTPKHSKKKDLATKIRLLDEYREIGTWRKKPVTETFLRKLAEYLLDWCDHYDGTGGILNFARTYKVGRSNFPKWAEMSPQFAAAYNHALEVIAEVKVELAADKKKNWEVVKYQLFTMGPKTRSDMVDYTKLKQPENQKSDQRIVVEVSAVPTSDMVPELPHES